MSAKRYEFDLQLLEKDLLEFGHDPHTHYYLGITHEAYAQSAAEMLGRDSAAIQEHLDEAVKYLSLRATAQYADEFIEERWAVSYQLGLLYRDMRVDNAKALYWLSLCRDYNPQQLECSLSLVQLHITLGQLAPALEEITASLKLDRSSRPMLTYYYQYDCQLPRTAVELLAYKGLQRTYLEGPEAMYILLLIRTAHQDVCAGFPKVSLQEDVKTLVNNAVSEAMSRRADYFKEDAIDWCEQTPLQQYLFSMEYLHHPCSKLREHQLHAKHCRLFSADVPPPHEDFQVAAGRADMFVGAALLPDIVHHVYGGSSIVFSSSRSRPIRFLFAQFFNPEMVFNLIGSLEKEDILSYEVVVVTPDAALIEFMKHTLEQTCAEETEEVAVQHVRYVPMLLKPFLESLKRQQEEKGEEKGGQQQTSAPLDFDYIEYNGGMSMDAAGCRSHLLGLGQILHDDGVIGMTYFSTNSHVDAVRSLLRGQNKLFFFPFSLERNRLIQQYLVDRKLEAHKKDWELVALMGGERHAFRRSYVPHTLLELEAPVNWTTYSQSEVVRIVGEQGLRVVSWIPTAYSHPYDELDHYSVKRYESFGIPQEEFVRTIMPNFRYSLYVTKAAAAGRNDHAHAVVGRPNISFDSVFGKDLLAKRVRISDRLGYLGELFKSFHQNAKSQVSSSIGFAHYASPSVALTFVVHPIIAASFSLLSTNPSIQELLDYNEQFYAQHRLVFDKNDAKRHLIKMIQFLERLNVITLSCDTGPITALGPAAEDRRPVVNANASGSMSVEERLKGRIREGRSIVHGGGIDFTFPGSRSQTRADEAGDKDHRKTTPADERLHDHAATTTTNKSPGKDRPIKGQGGGASGGLSTEVKIKRMRALGLSDDAINRMFGINGNSSSTKTDTLADDVKPVAVDAYGSTTISATSASHQMEPKPQSSDQDEQTTKRQIESIHKRLQSLVDHASDPRKVEPVEKKDAFPEGGSPVSGGKLSLLKSLSEKLKTSGGGGGTDLSSRDKYAQAPPTLSNDDGALADYCSEAASKVILPTTTQTETSLRESFRKMDCISRLKDADCQPNKRMSRRTTQLTWTSWNKIRFDLSQLQHLTALLPSQDLYRDAQGRFVAVTQLNDTYVAVQQFIKDSGFNDSYRVVKLMLNSRVKDHIHRINRLVHLSDDRHISTTSLVHLGAMRYLQSVSVQLMQNDFLVVDVIMQPTALRQLSEVLLGSTVWFDVTNGASFVSHYDDGLVFESISSAVKQISFALSPDPSKPIRVSSYYAVAMSLGASSAASHVSMANEDEVMVVLWLNPLSSSSSEGSEKENDGLRIYDDVATATLFSQGVSIYPSAHGDFLSRTGNLAIDLESRCGIEHSEYVVRKANRMVIVRGRRPVAFLTPGPAVDGEEQSLFSQSSMMALVVKLLIDE